MPTLMSILPKFLNLGFLIAFCVQIGFLVNDALYHPELNSEMRKVPLSGQPFPLTFTICLTPGFKEEQLKKFGYDSGLGYYFGMTSNLTEAVGWAGRSKDGSKYDQEGKCQCNILSGSPSWWCLV